MLRSFVICIAASLSLLASGAIVLQAQRLDSFGQSAKENQIFSLINRERSRSGLGALEWNPDLAQLARDYSQTMARQGFFDHIDRQGNSVVERARHARIRGWQKIGENLFECEPTGDLAGLAIRGWMHSETHRENILDPEWRATGIGIAYASSGDIYVTEVFADN